MASVDTESATTPKRFELRVLWDEICPAGQVIWPGDLSSSSESKSITADDRTSRLRKLIKELQRINCQRSRSYVPNEVLYLVFSFIPSPLPLNLRFISFESQSG